MSFGSYEGLSPKPKRDGLPIRFTRNQLIMASFLVIILVGTCLLMLPGATREGEETTLLGTFFTSTSATCVTGLVVYDTCTHWTLFGQLVILLQIQIGGLGFVTIRTIALVWLGKRIGLMGRELIHDGLNTLNLGGGIKLVRLIVGGTFFFEGAGAVLLSIAFIPDMGVAQGIYYAIFHSVSAFCNAGFDLMGYIEPYCSFTYYATNPLVVFTICGLIIIGGIGFLVWDDIVTYGLSWKRYRLQTKIVLFTTLSLLVMGTVGFLITERNGLFVDYDFFDRFLMALFAAVTPRTAGFNTIDIKAMTNASKILTIFLMFIGGSPGSTAGGVKTTTIAVVILFTKSYLLHDGDCVAFKRRLGDDTIRRASVAVFINFSLAFIAILLILMNQSLPATDVIFEAFSAIGTVGMSTGVTRNLNALSQVINKELLNHRRDGSVNSAISLTERKRPGKIRYPEEAVIVG